MVVRRFFARLTRALVVIVAGTAIATATLIPADAATAKAKVAVAPMTLTVTPGGTVSLGVRLINVSTKTIAAGQLAFSSETNPLSTTAAVSEWLSKKAGGPLPGRSIASQSVSALTRGETRDITVTIPASRLANLNTWGVRGISVSYQSGGATIEFARTTVILDTGVAPGAVRLSTVVPLVSPPSALGLASKDDLETATGPDGYLTQMLALINAHVVSVAVDPRLTTSILTLGAQAPESARAWLASLNAQVRDGFWLSYGDSDLAGQIQAGATAPLVPQISDLPNLPSSVLATSDPLTTSLAQSPLWPGWNPTLSDVAWPLANSIASGNLTKFASSNYQRLVIASGNLVDAASRNSRATVDGLSSVISNDAVSTCLSRAQRTSDALTRDSALSCVASYLAATVSQYGGTSTVVTSLSRIADALALDYPLDSTYSRLTQLAWVKPALLSDVFAGSPRAATLKSRPESPSRVAAIRQRIKNQASIVAFSDVASEPTKVVNPGERREASVLSNGWTSYQDWTIACAMNEALTTEVLNSVAIVTSSTINMVGGQARIPVVVRNDLDSPVSVVLKAEPSNARLVVEKSVALTIEQNSQNRAYIPVSARVGSGSVDLEITLTNSEGTPIGQSRTIPVRVRADWEAWGLVGIGLVFVALVVAGVIRTIRKRKVRS